MRILVVALSFGMIAFFGIPLLNEMDPNPCGAHDSIASRNTALSITGRNYAAFGQSGGRRLLKGLPTGQVSGLSCTTEYWRILTQSHRIA